LLENFIFMFRSVRLAPEIRFRKLCESCRIMQNSLALPDTTAVQGLAVWRGAQARCDFAEALRCPAVLQCGAQPILQICQILIFGKKVHML